MTERPTRIERRRRRGWTMPADAIYVGRPTRWGNPFDWRQGVEHGGAEWARGVAVKLYREWLRGKHPEKGAPPTMAEIQGELRGKQLACWCSLHDTCHADVLLEIANG